MDNPNRCICDSPRSLQEWFALCELPFPVANGVPSVVSASISAFTDDSRLVQPGDVFVAVRGGLSDGHHFLQQAANHGAAVAIVEEQPSEDLNLPCIVPCIVVENTKLALAKLSAACCGLVDRSAVPLDLIGVTGTNGKTTVTWLLRSILQQAGYDPALLGTIEYDLHGERCQAPLTTPGSIELAGLLKTARGNGARWGVLEVSSHALEQRRCDGLSFRAAIFTNLSGDHLDYHGSMEAYGKSKGRLFDLLHRDGMGVVNLDDEWGRRFAKSLSSAVVTFSMEDERADYRATVSKLDTSGSVFSVEGDLATETLREIRLPLIGHYNVSNALAAAATSLALGVAPAAIRSGMEQIAGIPGRLERVRVTGCPFTVLVDYAHTDAALSNALQALRPLTPGRLIGVFGCGGDRDRSKRPRMGQAAARWADVAVVTSDNPRSEDPAKIIDDILAGMDCATEGKVITQVDRRSAIEWAIHEAQAGDTVLIAGKGHENYQLVGEQVLEFDDVSVAKGFLQKICFTEGVA